MTDDVLDCYVNKLIASDIEYDKFNEYIEMFSKFLGYGNPDYKYNGTYLSKYILEFEQICSMLKIKNEKYYEIFGSLISLVPNFELLIDRMFFAKYESSPDVICKYIGFNKNTVLSSCIEVKVTIFHKNNEYIICKKYENNEDKLVEKVSNDVNAFMKRMKDRRKTNGTT